MNRLSVSPRHHWQQKVEELGLIFHTPEGQTYWDESACYQLLARDVETLESATEELQRLCLAAGQFMLDSGRMDNLAIPAAAQPVIRAAWEAEPPSLYGRFDLAWDGIEPPKLLEYNADTPTALLEAAVVQWYWRGEVFPATDQFNSIHEKLVAKWTELRRYLQSAKNGSKLYFTSMDSEEDRMTIGYLRDTATQAGLAVESLAIEEIGWNARTATFRDREDRPIKSIFALYPWEWLLRDFSGPLLATYANVDWIEPIWKMLWSNKGLLAVLWEMFPGHPNLLPAYLDGPRELTKFVRKPLLSREGSNVTIVGNGQSVSTAGPYGAEGFIYQAVAPGFAFDRLLPVFGSWYVIDQGAAGIGIREDLGITGNLSRFVPHFID